MWAVWVGLILGLSEFADHDFLMCVVIVLGLGSIAFHIAFQRSYVYKQMHRDWQMGLNFDRELRAAISERGDEVPSDDSYRWWWAHAWQPTVTAIIVTITILALATA